eukprot:TRINITY_DN31165_c0_g1_i1.p1 TRINITY_DN31165_c0_g1~~TRINITY_DN31165_c0_g1_i1.p1  ORF type:complete len:191 (+),score=36.30 TRINITY_DN31165_c0_g1_i1:261-833(+)
MDPPTKKRGRPPKSKAEPSAKPSPKKPKTAEVTAKPARGRGRPRKDAQVKNNEAVSPQVTNTNDNDTVTPQKSPRPRGRPPKSASVTPIAKTEDETTEQNRSKSRNIVIEHCKQCQCFKRSAAKVENGLKEAFTDLKVTINPDKPRRGCFEVRDDKGNLFLSLQDLKRPFTKLKEWDLDKTVADIIDKIK